MRRIDRWALGETARGSRDECDGKDHECEVRDKRGRGMRAQKNVEGMISDRSPMQTGVERSAACM
jgi:hypothetical protein